MGFLSVIGIKGVLIIALVLGLGGWAGYKHYQLYKAEADRDQAIADRDRAGVARDAAIEVTKNNQRSIDALRREKTDIQTALNNLDSDRKKNQAVITNLSAAIAAGAANPENQIGLSPVLKATVDGIQRRRAGAP